MAKDPAFLFYPGDAAEDVSHMNRLERGAYFDFVQAQKKFGPLSLQTIKKIFGKDFDLVWDALKMCLTYEEDMYFIAWLKDSIEKRKKYSASRASNRKGQNNAKNKDFDSTYVNHMVIENINRNEIVIESEKGVQGEKQPPPHEPEIIGTPSPKGLFVSIQKKYITDRVKTIFGADGLKTHFERNNQLEAIIRANWIDFQGFMEKNPGNMFTDANHLYNSFRNHHLKKHESTTSKTKRTTPQQFDTADYHAKL